MKEYNEHVEHMNLDDLEVATLRTLAMDMVQAANSGHPGAPMGCAPMAHVLWSQMRMAPKHLKWLNRDRFVLSNGHASALNYALLHCFGYDLPLEEIKAFRQWGSKTPGHPENHVTAGLETTTGPLGQGFANAVGFAIAETHLAARYNKEGYQIVDHHTYVICGDGCLMEGVTAEAASLAGHLGLGKLIVLYDNNGITIDGKTDVSFSEDVAKRFEAYGWLTINVTDGNDRAQIAQAIKQAKAQSERPVFISVKTHIGFGSPHFQDTSKVHGSPLGAEEIKLTKKAYGWPEDAAFFVPERIAQRRTERLAHSEECYSAWLKTFEQYTKAYPELSAELTRRLKGDLPQDWDQLTTFAPNDKGMATRAALGKAIEQLHARIPELMGGSADLAESNKTLVPASGRFCKEDRAGRNIFFGIREHAMGAICNGMALYGGFIPYGATFLVFSDYMRHCIRLGALESAHCLWLWTHDSIGVGEDGPTHQPVEHLASLRAIPDFVMIRPGDANETLEAMKFAIRSKRPVGLALSRQNCRVLDRNHYAPASGLAQGGYIVAGQSDPQYIIIATGTEVDLAIEAYERLKSEGLRGRVVSMPACTLFDEQSAEYKESVLPHGVKCRVAVEAAIQWGWERYIGDRGVFVGMCGFGASAPAEVLYEKFGITAEAVVQAVKSYKE